MVFTALSVLAGIARAQPAEPEDFRTVFRKGVDSYEQGRYEEAVDFLEKVVEMNPDFAPSYNYLGLAHQNLDARTSDLVWLFNTAITLDPDYAEAYLNRCRVYYQAGQADEAESSCLRALEINPSLHAAELTLAWVFLLGKSDAGRASEYFERLMASGVHHPSVYLGLGMAYSQKGDRGKVLEIVTQLRGMGEEEMAVSLERAMRASSAAGENPPGPAPERPVAQPSQLISARPEEPSPLPEEGPMSGKMRIRLRGQLTNAPQEGPGSITEETQEGGSAGEDSDLYDTGSAAERIQRIRQLRHSITVQGKGTIY